MRSRLVSKVDRGDIATNHINNMANNMTLGARKAMVNGMSEKEVARFEHFDAVPVTTGDIIIPISKLFIEREVISTRAENSRVFSVICVIRHADGRKPDVCEISLNWLSGKESSAAAVAKVMKSAKTGKLYLRYTDTSFNAPSLPLAVGKVGFTYDFTLEVGEAVECYAMKDFSFAFEENPKFVPSKPESDSNQRWLNTTQITEIGEGNEVELTKTSRYILTRKAAANLLAAEKRVALAMFTNLTGVTPADL